ncbi:MAG: hypothetical protein A3H69_00600 [Candidatus Sungbacteria bacterium RIFCSPLOWO2_02_FULL_47_9]|uniref:ABC transporter domain-containing protein n=1 Tax=Candidatus Sungbacteria bacterium RIFCSPHIGHO2_01_FULL_47_32 TaxID=1802264 RepID=A0A1G2K4A2_9BACT|nr:MAG: ABC transporter related protein [Parcubacteria group bacterium GW2011_GWA2_47_10]OGZ93441.1 MAG: hypothetical protein A2633_01815 [Candidatus Sungbacteria bacterium RIFCSPHIGHO2_01_FULL_47_32]OGZ99809.1 MAG: hypothetical protein A3D57_01100 [Candidatus Sungbacteria bacterium RIFCSPHIGHO2_02_FULL_46_12]OHA05024.1 MAG: hypothetical protein A3A28_03765 [Candidatus Sungbacteria bacterium RIFCSPLOWO2_01_FULL_47_32]OHA11861.1 MAG: hypothetical protein A3H69_00600 [Candidatus Sungbacteria bact
MEKENILEVKNLTVVLDGETLLKDITFSVVEGEALSIIGPNGAGKTLLFRALLGFIPYKGEITWRDGVKIGYVPQKFLVERSTPITVREFFLLHSKHFWAPEKSFVGHLSHELSLVGLSKEILGKPMGEISGGQLQRVLVSWALIDHPDVLLFDEPTAGIDVGGEETIYTIMHKIQDEWGTTILQISHDLNMVYRYTPKVLCINKKMICNGAPQDVLSPKELSKIYGGSAFYHHIDS